jgi:hypothetical protein
MDGRGETGMALEPRVVKLETALIPEGRILVIPYCEACETPESASARAGPCRPQDLVILVAQWRPCNGWHPPYPITVYPRQGG